MTARLLMILHVNWMILQLLFLLQIIKQKEGNNSAKILEFYIPLTVHLGIILVSNQLDALFSMYLFISLLYTFRATQCLSSGEMNCINTSSGICHSV